MVLTIEEISMAKKEQMRVLYFAGWDDGEMEGFFEVIDGNVCFITGWSRNDANYRPEYMDGLLNYLGVIIQSLPEKHHKKAKQLLFEAFGI
jgi:hypothetical protein